MEHITDTLSHSFNPWITVITDSDGGNPRLGEIDFAESYMDSTLTNGGEFVSVDLSDQATAFLDSLLPQIKEAIQLIASGCKLAVDRGTSADGRSLYGCLWTSDARHIENDGGPCEVCGEDY